MSTTVSIRLWNPEGTLPDGRTFIARGGLEWQQVNYLRPDQCQHQETICRTCLEIWELDWEIDLDTIADLDADAGEADPDVVDDGDVFEQAGYAAGPGWDDDWDED